MGGSAKVEKTHEGEPLSASEEKNASEGRDSRTPTVRNGVED